MKTFLSSIFAALWLLDTAATIAFVTSHGLIYEANPFMRALIDCAGLGAFAMFKSGVLAFWLALQQHAHVWIHCSLVGIMVPVSLAAITVAWGAS